MRKRRRTEASGGLPVWLQTYGDMVTLVLTFFVALYAMSSLDKEKYVKLANSLRIALGGGASAGIMQSGNLVGDKGTPSAPAPVATEAQMNAQQARAWKEIYNEINKILSQAKFQGKVEVSQTRYEILISFKEKLFFQKGSADILNEAFPALQEVGAIIRDHTYPFRVEGHTCDLPINTPQYPSNWELSVMRAVNVSKYLMETVKIDPARVAVAGYGQFRPIVPNTNETNRARNRRVDLIVINSFYQHQ